MGCKGSISIEACIVIPLLIAFVSVLFCINYNIFIKTEEMCSTACVCDVDFSDVHRAAVVIFETGGELYDLFFS